MTSYESLHKTLSFYGVNCHKPYYISSGNPIFNYPTTPFRLDFYALCICTEGYLQVEIDNQQYNISQYNFLISAPSTIIKFLHSSEDFRMKLLFFDQNFLLKNLSDPFILEKLGIFKNLSFSIQTADEDQANLLLRLLEYLHDKTRIAGKFSEDIVRTIVFNILLEVAEIIHAERAQFPEDPQQEGNTPFLKFLKLVQLHVIQHRDIQFYADLLFVSGKHLIKIVKKSSGKTPLQLINETLLKEAYILLNNPELTFSEIAYQLNFCSASTFGRFFKKHTQMSPSEFRNTQIH
ncbi:AraC family transcriptional regulator [Elizabethkingia sp. JS20170427COW]|uniref:helix-turn-helix domain-containing protein n=1 Tax=Elizabethkingia sp. JS20170427COW TaxID=2583851 RepID=UPI001110D35B|nr:AraC family transcriptional regulator [Elizabethkingia sp. JS20170427COW]QCX52445.1 AraC family transcriptional regulator [Elizabethkingia sp. JS20170427COW]